MRKNREIKEAEENQGVIITRDWMGNTKVYEVIAITKNGLYVGRDKNGIKECFSEYDVGKIGKRYIRDIDESSGKYR